MTGGNRAAIAAVGVAIGAYGFAFGVLAAGSGLTSMQVAALSILAYSGGAQAAFVGALSTGTPVSALGSALLVNLRLGIYGTMAGRILGDASPARRLVGVHLASDETIALASTAPAGERVGTYWRSGCSFFAIWVGSTIAGSLAGERITDPAAFGLDVAFPAVFAALLAPLLTTRTTRLAAVAGAGATVIATPLLAPGVPILVAVGAALATVSIAGRGEDR